MAQTFVLLHKSYYSVEGNMSWDHLNVRVFIVENAVLTLGSTCDTLLYSGLQWERNSYFHLFPCWLNLHWVTTPGCTLTPRSLSASLQGGGVSFEWWVWEKEPSMCIGLREACAYLSVPDKGSGISNIGDQSVCKFIIAGHLGHILQTALWDIEATISIVICLISISSSLFPLQVGEKRWLFIRYPQHSRTTL